MVRHGSWYGGGAKSSDVRKQREMNADVPFIFLLFSILFSLGPQGMDGMTHGQGGSSLLH